MRRFQSLVGHKLSGGHFESDISNIDICVNIYIVSKQVRRYRYFDIYILSPNKNKNKEKHQTIVNKKIQKKKVAVKII